MAYGFSEVTQNGTVYRVNDPNIADEFSPSQPYVVGNHVTYNGILYRFKDNHDAGAWNASHVEAVKTGDEISDLKSAINLSHESGYETFSLYGKFEHYGLQTDGTFKTTEKYRVSCETHFVFNRDLTISVAPGFRWGYIPFINNAAGTWSGWYTRDYKMPAGTEFVIQIARVTENTSEIANVNEFVSALTFPTKNENEIKYLKYNEGQIQSNALYTSGTMISPTFIIGTRYVNNNKDAYSYDQARLSFDIGEYIELKQGDIVSRNADVIAEFGGGYSTDSGVTFVSISSRSSKYVAPYDGMYFFWLKKINAANFDSTDVKSGWKYITFTRPNSSIEILNSQVSAMSENIDSLNKVSQLNSDLFSDATWEQGLITENGDLTSTVYLRTKEYLCISKINKVVLWCDSGYKYYYLLYNENKTFISAIPTRTSEITVDVQSSGASYIRVVLRRADEGVITSSEGQHMHGSLSTPLLDASKNIESLSNRTNVVENLFRFKPYFSHIGVNKTSNIVIPSQSVADVMRTKRLGFDVLELNVLKTSDNEYICLHGSSGKFGAQFVGADNSDVSDIAVSSKTLDWIKSNVRYVTKYDAYKTAPYTLQEMLYECKKLGVVPLVQYVDMTMVGILNEIMGLDNYILNLYNNDRGVKTNSVCFSWTAIGSADSAVEKCQSNGQNYVLGINMSDNAFESFEDSDWKNYFNKIHEAGYFTCTAYLNEQKVPSMFNLGLDVLASDAQINEIESGNLCNLFSGSDFSDFITNGIVSSGILSLTSGQTITPTTQLSSVFLGGGSLHIRFSGKIYVTLGKIVTSYTSDGSSDVWISSYFEEAIPTFTIEADQNVSVYELSYKASKM